MENKGEGFFFTHSIDETGKYGIPNNYWVIFEKVGG